MLKQQLTGFSLFEICAMVIEKYQDDASYECTRSRSI